MKMRLFSLLICSLIGFSLQAQKSKSTNQYIGIRANFGLNIQTSSYYGSYSHLGTSIEYSRNFHNQYHYLASGIDFNISILQSRLSVEELAQYSDYQELQDVGVYLSIPTHYIYQPFSWVYIRSGFNNKFVFRNVTNGQGIHWEYSKEGLPDYRKYIFETHAALGFSLPIKRVRIALEAYLSYPIFTDEYLRRGLNLGVYYKL